MLGIAIAFAGCLRESLTWIHLDLRRRLRNRRKRRRPPSPPKFPFSFAGSAELPGISGSQCPWKNKSQRIEDSEVYTFPVKRDKNKITLNVLDEYLVSNQRIAEYVFEEPTHGLRARK